MSAWAAGVDNHWGQVGMVVYNMESYLAWENAFMLTNETVPTLFPPENHNGVASGEQYGGSCVCVICHHCQASFFIRETRVRLQHVRAALGGLRASKEEVGRLDPIFTKDTEIRLEGELMVWSVELHMPASDSMSGCADVGAFVGFGYDGVKGGKFRSIVASIFMRLLYVARVACLIYLGLRASLLLVFVSGRLMTPSVCSGSSAICTIAAHTGWSISWEAGLI